MYVDVFYGIYPNVKNWQEWDVVFPLFCLYTCFLNSDMEITLRTLKETVFPITCPNLSIKYPQLRHWILLRKKASNCSPPFFSFWREDVFPSMLSVQKDLFLQIVVNIFLIHFYLVILFKLTPTQRRMSWKCN